MRSEPRGAACRDLVKTYWTESGRVEALKGVDAEFRGSCVTAVMGPSGSGKSSLLRILAGLDRATAGAVAVGDVELGGLSPRRLRLLRRGLVGYVFQRPADNFVSYLTVAEHLELARRGAHDEPVDPDGLLERLEITHRKDHLPHELSGGEQQRAAFAQVLVAAPALVVADEPTAELDTHSGAALLDSVRSLTERGVGFIIATHDKQVAASADEIISIDHGNIESPEDRWKPR